VDDPEHAKILGRMTPADKLQAAMRLYWSARALKTVAVRQQHPNWSDAAELETVIDLEDSRRIHVFDAA
jgi:hypothetical protein